MTRTKFIEKWLGNQCKDYIEKDIDEMRDDLDKVCKYQTKEQLINFVTWLYNDSSHLGMSAKATVELYIKTNIK